MAFNNYITICPPLRLFFGDLGDVGEQSGISNPFSVSTLNLS
jgi:hypothetical protein